MKFVGSYVNNFPENKPYVLIAGRSNVGKSSLINALANTKMARTSKEPGLTSTLNFYDFNNVYMVDTPGYGYAKKSKQERELWAHIIDNFINLHKDNILLTLSLIDALVGPTELDQALLRYFEDIGLNTIIVLTKIDKPNQKELNNTLNCLKAFNMKILKTSSKYNEGIKELRNLIMGIGNEKRQNF